MRPPRALPAAQRCHHYMRDGTLGGANREKPPLSTGRTANRFHILRPMKQALIALEDGRTFSGEAFGAHGTTVGEICFNTSMTGYQEVLTDPSYRGQIVTMTYPLIGNYGVNTL